MRNLIKILITLLICLIPMQAFALTPAQRTEIERRPFYDPTDVPCGQTSITTVSTSTLPADFPEPLKSVFTEAANNQQTDPIALASLYMVENGIKDYKSIANRGPDITKYNSGWATSSAGAQGPFQFLPSTWKPDFGDINNLKDAANAAAKVFLKDLGGIPPTGAQDGDLAAKTKGTLSYVFGAYNGGPGYSPASVRGYVDTALKNYHSIQGTTSSSAPTTATSTNPSASPPSSSTNTNTTNSSQAPKKVYMLGDSITVGAYDKYKAAFQAKGIDAFINASGGSAWTMSGSSKTPEGSTKKRSEAVVDDTDQIKSANAIVIALGTNGGLSANPIQEMITKIHTINPTAPIYWVNTAEKNTNKIGLGAFNKSLDDLAGSLNYKVISWVKAINPSADPYTMPISDPNGFIGDNYVHPSATGQDALVPLVVNTVASGGSATISSTPSNNCPASSSQGVGTCLDDGRAITIKDPEKVAEAINTYAQQKGLADAPLGKLGDKFVSGSARAGVNPFLLVHIAIQESSYGKAIPDGSYNSFGRTATSSQPSVSANGRNWYKYDSFADSLDGGGTKDDQPTYLKKVYIDDGKITIKDIMMKYAPPSDGNDTEGYINKIKATIKALVDLSGDAIDCSGGSGGTAKDITYANKAELLQRIKASKNIVIQPINGADVEGDLQNVAQEGLLKLITQIGEQYGKPVTIRLIKSGQGNCGDFAQGATNYGPYTSSHAYGLAVDINGNSSDPNIVSLDQWLYNNRNVLNIGELEHSPVPEGVKNIKFGGDYDYPAAIQADHQDHIHVAVKGTGVKSPECQAKPNGEVVN